MRRAPVFAVATTAGLLLLGLPFLGVKFGTVDDRQLPKTAESHVVQQHIRDGFPGSPGGGLTVLAEGRPGPPSSPPTGTAWPSCPAWSVSTGR